MQSKKKSLYLGPGRTGGVVLALALGLFLLAGCANSPDDYRVFQQNITLQNQNAALKAKLVNQQREIKTLQAQLAAKTPRVATLPPSRLADLFRVHSIKIKKQTATAKFHGGKTLRGFRVFVATLMAGGDALPATGQFTISAFDLGVRTGPAKIGQWVFTARQSKKRWYGMFGLNCFAFDCPWKHPPSHRQITFRVHFRDSLTGRVFTAQRLLSVHLTSR